MTSLRRVITAIIIVLAVAVQSAVIARWNLPGATPDLVLVVVAAFGSRHQASRAAALGFGAGLLLDATPPAHGLLGISAFVLAIVGFFAAQFRTDIARSVFGPLAFVAAAAGASAIVKSVLGTLLGDPSISITQMPIALISGVFYSTLLAMLVVPLVRGLLMLVMPAPTEVLRR